MMSDSNFDTSNLPCVKIVKITPQITAERLFEYRHCYMGISLDNPVFQGKLLHALLDWACEKFDTCLIVTGDYLRRHNEHILNGLDDDRAAQAALAAGDEFIQRYSQLLDRLGEDKISVIRWRDCLAFDEYRTSRAVLDRLFAQDAAFEEALRRDAIAFVGRQKKKDRQLAVTEEQAVAISCEYLLEEIAVFSALSEQGRHVELYPGAELDVLVEVANGAFQDIPSGLRQRINVELKCNSSKADPL